MSEVFVFFFYAFAIGTGVAALAYLGVREIIKKLFDKQ